MWFSVLLYEYIAIYEYNLPLINAYIEFDFGKYYHYGCSFPQLFWCPYVRISLMFKTLDGNGVVGG